MTRSLRRLLWSEITALQAWILKVWRSADSARQTKIHPDADARAIAQEWLSKWQAAHESNSAEAFLALFWEHGWCVPSASYHVIFRCWARWRDKLAFLW
jgi:hypothetical protein